MSRFWGVRGHFTEGRRRLKALLGLTGDGTSTRVKALNGAASLAIDQGDHQVARDLLGESIRLSQQLGYRRGEATALVYLGRSLIASECPAEAGPHIDRALQLLEGLDDPAALATALLYAGLAAHFTGQLEEACARYGRSVELCRAVGFRSVGARSLQLLGHIPPRAGRHPRGAQRVRGGPADVPRARGPLGCPHRHGRLRRGGGPHRPAPAGPAAGGSGAGALRGRPVQHAGGVEAQLERWLAPARNQLGSAAAQVMAEGRQMSLAEAVSYALADEPEEAWRGGPRRTLTRRELEVASLVAQGLTNRGIAGQLYLSVRTVDTHVDHVLTKLGFSNRAQLVAWAYESGLAPKDT